MNINKPFADFDNTSQQQATTINQLMNHYKSDVSTHTTLKIYLIVLWRTRIHAEPNLIIQQKRKNLNLN